MLSGLQHDQTLAFAENVTLLSLISHAPTAPQLNSRARSGDDSSRVLSAEQEATLTSAVAFLCGISDDPSHVVAACVEEPEGKRGTRIVVAINKESPTSGDDVLKRIRTGLEKICALLSRVSGDGDASLEEKVLDAIVNMCKQRIFARVASQRFATTHSKMRRAFLQSPTMRIVDAVRGHVYSRKLNPEVESFTSGALKLAGCLAEIETCPATDVDPCIKRLLRTAYAFNKTADFDSVLSGINSAELNPNTKTGFVRRLGKLARYQECCIYLLKVARRTRLFQNANVIFISPDVQLFAKTLKMPPESGLGNCLARCQNDGGEVFPTSTVLAKKLHTSDSSFRSSVQQRLSGSHIHAEVQIVCYYEPRTATRKPRVICSSKDACYLCNLFIRLHGKFDIPKTHGNLYPRWHLPPLASFDGVRTQLNQSLEAQIRELLQRIMRDSKVKLPFALNQNESTVFPLGTSSLSLPLSLAEATLRREPAEEEGKSDEAGDVIAPDPPVGDRLPTVTTTTLLSEVHRPTTPEPPSPESLDSPRGPPVVWDLDELSAREPQSPFTEPDEPAHDPQSCLIQTDMRKSNPKDILVGPKQVSEPNLVQLQELSATRAPDPIPAPSEAQHEPAPLHPESSPASASVPSTTQQRPAPDPPPNQLAADEPSPPRCLTPGETVSLPLDNSSSRRGIPRFKAGLVTVHPELFHRALEATHPIELRIQWLTRQRAAAFTAARPRGFVDLEKLRAGVDVDCGSAECVYLGYRGEVVEVEFLESALCNGQ